MTHKELIIAHLQEQIASHGKELVQSIYNDMEHGDIVSMRTIELARAVEWRLEKLAELRSKD